MTRIRRLWTFRLRVLRIQSLSYSEQLASKSYVSASLDDRIIACADAGISPPRLPILNPCPPAVVSTPAVAFLILPLILAPFF